MPRSRLRRKVRVSDIARIAGVGTATVDRVLHGRGSVSDLTADRVRAAMDTLAAERPAVGRHYAPTFRFEALLPAHAGRSTERLGRALEQAALKRGCQVQCGFVEKMNPFALADRLDGARRSAQVDGIAFQALDHPLVHEAVSRIADDGTPVVTLMSGLGGSSQSTYVGTNNRAAGRTAGYLMGRFCRMPGQVAILWGGELYRSHEEREIGFRSVLRSEFRQLEVLDLVSGGDEAEENHRQISAVIQSHPELVGIYSVGGGNQGVVKAMQDQRAGDRLTLIAHNLTETTREYLMDGSVDVIIHQDMELAANTALSTLIAKSGGVSIEVPRIPIEIVTKENMVDRI